MSSLLVFQEVVPANSTLLWKQTSPTLKVFFFCLFFLDLAWNNLLMISNNNFLKTLFWFDSVKWVFWSGWIGWMDIEMIWNVSEKHLNPALTLSSGVRADSERTVGVDLEPCRCPSPGVCQLCQRPEWRRPPEGGQPEQEGRRGGGRHAADGQQNQGELCLRGRSLDLRPRPPS